MTNEQLVALIKAGEDVAGNMLQLWQQNRGFISKLARKYRGYEEVEDLEQQGYIGLCDAVDGYRQEEGAFLTYAAFWIRQSMRRYIGNCGSMVRIPEGKAGQVREYRKLRRLFEASQGRAPTEWEAARLMGINRERVRELEKDAAMLQIGSLDSPVQTAEGNTLVGDLVADDRDMHGDTLDKLQQEQLRGVLWPMVDALLPEVSSVIHLRFGEEKTLEEVGEAVGKPREWVRRCEAKGLRELGAPHRRAVLAPFLYDFIDTHARSGSSAETFRRTWTSSTERTALQLYERY